MKHTVTVYSVIGPTEVELGGLKVPGGQEYLVESLRLLSQKNPEILFEVHLAHWIGHGPLNQFPAIHNISLNVHLFTPKNIKDFHRYSQVEEHGVLLNALILNSFSTNRYSIIMDPDFFIIQNGLIAELINYMDNKGLSAMGVSYPARYPIEYSWNYPQVYFCMLNNHSVNLLKINFKSGTVSNELEMLLNERTTCIVKLLRKINQNRQLSIFFPQVRMILKQFEGILSLRALINPLDTGWRLSRYLDVQHYEVFPNIVNCNTLPIKSIFHRLPFKFIKSYTLEDRILNWHFLSRGFANGTLGSKWNPIFFICKVWFNKIGYTFPENKWPLSSIFDKSQLIDCNTYELYSKKLFGADFYAFESRILGVHLGHEAKSRINMKLSKLLENL